MLILKERIINYKINGFDKKFNNHVNYSFRNYHHIKLNGGYHLIYKKCCKFKKYNNKTWIWCLNENQHLTSENKEWNLNELCDLIILAFLGCQTRSLYVARCFVEIMIEIYNQGFTDKEIQVKLMITNLENGKNILSDDEYNVLISWCTLVLLTLKECYYNIKENDNVQIDMIKNLNVEQLGMLNFIKGVKQRFHEGYNLKYLLKQQQRQRQRQRQNIEDNMSENSPTLRLMQQNTLLVAITLDILSKDINLTINDDIEMLSMKALISFNGANIGNTYSMESFVKCILKCYKNGYAAYEITNTLPIEAFEHQDGLPPAIQVSQMSPNIISKKIFTRWISMIYMALAQMGYPHKLAKEIDGWAIAEITENDDDIIELYQISSFVCKTIEKYLDGININELKMNKNMDNKIVDMMNKNKNEKYNELVYEKKFQTTYIEDDSLHNTSSSMLMFKNMDNLIKITVNTCQEFFN